MLVIQFWKWKGVSKNIFRQAANAVKREVATMKNESTSEYPEKETKKDTKSKASKDKEEMRMALVDTSNDYEKIKT